MLDILLSLSAKSFFSNRFWCAPFKAKPVSEGLTFDLLNQYTNLRQITTFFSYHNYMFKDFCGIINACTVTLKDLPLPWVTKKITFHFPAATCEPSKDPRITIPSIVNITFTMLSETLSILQSFAYNDKPCFEKHWLEYSWATFSLSFIVVFLNTLTFLSPSIHKKLTFPLRISCGFGQIH